MGHYLAGLQWVMGDLQAEATLGPRPPLLPLANDDALCNTAARTAFTDTQLPFEWLDAAIAEAGTDAGALAQIERRLVALLSRAAGAEVAMARLEAAGQLTGRAAARIHQGLLNDASLPEAVRYARSPEPAVARAALDLLARWPDPAAIVPLIAHAEDPATSPDARIIAAQAAMRHSERAYDDFPQAERSAVLGRMLKVTAEEDRRSHLLFLLSRCDDDLAVSVASEYSSVPGLARAANYALESIAANKLWPPELAASGAGNRLRLAVDGRADTFWSVPAREGQWLRIDFKQVRPLRPLTLSQGSRRDEFPQRYSVHVTDDPDSPGPALVEGQGARSVTTISFPEGHPGPLRDCAADGNRRTFPSMPKPLRPSALIPNPEKASLSHLRRRRHHVENFFGRIKGLRRIGTRYDKLAHAFLSFPTFSDIIDWIRFEV